MLNDERLRQDGTTFEKDYFRELPEHDRRKRMRDEEGYENTIG